jgi:arylformamidase
MAPLFSLLREGYEEVRADGELVVVEGGGIVYRTGEAMGVYPARSLLKPFQFLATGLGPPRGRHVPALGSISATAEQVAEIERWYRAQPQRAFAERVKLAPPYPMDEAHRVALKAAGRPPSVFCHPCFSKHAAIVEACALHGWNEQGYASTTHPFHLRLLSTLASLLDERIEPVDAVADGCLLPSPVLSIRVLAHLYERLASAPAASPLGAIAAAMLENPEWVGGPGRLDTRIMQANPARVIAKEGADGLLGLAVLSGRDRRALGVVLKIAAGYSPRLSEIALAPLLHSIGLELPAESHAGHTIRYHYRPFRESGADWFDISPELAEHTAVWPGDVPFRRDLTSEAWADSGVSVSCIHSTVHIGAHADAPNHIDGTGHGIDAVDLRHYAGPCQVVAVTRPRGTLLVPADLADTPICAPRVLFKTGSFPDPRAFNEDFVACSREIMQWLASRGIVLVGIDTPSVDPCHSKELPAHRASIGKGMAILEGLVLDAVEPGVYELIALPLKLRGADASPVRAVLRLAR